MPSPVSRAAIALSGVLLVATVATAERHLVMNPLGEPAPRPAALELAGVGDPAATSSPTLSQSASAILQVARTGENLGRVHGVVTLLGPTAPPDRAQVTFTLYGTEELARTDGAAPYSVRVDTRDLPNGAYKLAVATRWSGGMSTRVARLMIANPAAPSTTSSPGPAPSASTTTTTTTRTTTTTTGRANPRPTTRPAPATTSKASSSTTQPSSYTDEVVRLTNVRRQANGCGDLAIDATLTKVAQAHSEDMADNNYFAHESQDGRSPFDRMTAAGYSYSAAAENIAAGQATPAEVVEGWMNSEGHRANILNCALKQIGVGYAVKSSSSYRTYWTQDFGTPR